MLYVSFVEILFSSRDYFACTQTDTAMISAVICFFAGTPSCSLLILFPPSLPPSLPRSYRAHDTPTLTNLYHHLSLYLHNHIHTHTHQRSGEVIPFFKFFLWYPNSVLRSCDNANYEVLRNLGHHASIPLYT